MNLPLAKEGLRLITITFFDPVLDAVDMRLAALQTKLLNFCSTLYQKEK